MAPSQTRLRESLLGATACSQGPHATWEPEAGESPELVISRQIWATQRGFITCFKRRQEAGTDLRVVHEFTMHEMLGCTPPQAPVPQPLVTGLHGARGDVASWLLTPKAASLAQDSGGSTECTRAAGLPEAHGYQNQLSLLESRTWEGTPISELHVAIPHPQQGLWDPQGTDHRLLPRAHPENSQAHQQGQVRHTSFLKETTARPRPWKRWTLKLRKQQPLAPSSESRTRPWCQPLPPDSALPAAD